MFPARGEASQLRLHKIRLVHRLREVIAGLGIAGLGIAAGVATTNGVLLINTRLPRISMHLDLSDDETLALLNLLTETIEADRYQFSPRIRDASWHPGENSAQWDHRHRHLPDRLPGASAAGPHGPAAAGEQPRSAGSAVEGASATPRRCRNAGLRPSGSRADRHRLIFRYVTRLSPKPADERALARVGF